MIRQCGAALGFFAFAITTFLGLAAGNSAEVTLRRSLWGMLVFFVIGLCTGWVANRVLDEHAVARNREMSPEEPDEEGAAATGGASDPQASGPAVRCMGAAFEAAGRRISGEAEEVLDG